MLQLEHLSPNQSLEGIEPSLIVTVVAAVPISPETRQLIYRLPNGSLRERLLTRADEAAISVATTSRPWSLDGDAALFQLTAEAKRIDPALLFGQTMADRASAPPDRRRL